MTYAPARRLYGRAAGVGRGSSWAPRFSTSRHGACSSRHGGLGADERRPFCFLLGVGEPPGPRRRWLFYGLYASAALATLTKGLMGFLIPGAVMLLWLVVCRPVAAPAAAPPAGRHRAFPGDRGAVARLVAGRNPGWAHFYFVYEHWERFTTSRRATAATSPGILRPDRAPRPLPLDGLPLVRAARRLAGGWARRGENADGVVLCRSGRPSSSCSSARPSRS